MEENELKTLKIIDWEKIHDLLQRCGVERLFNLLFGGVSGLAMTGSSLHTDRRTRQAAEAQRLAAEDFRRALPQLLRVVQSKEVRIVQGAFNSTPAFIDLFTCAALLGIAFTI
jgi:hypothetical protein